MHNVKPCRHLLYLAIAVLLASLAPNAGLAKEARKFFSKFYVAGIASEKEMTTFFTRFQEAVARHDRNKVVAMVNFPLEVVLGATGDRLKITSREEFLAQYDNIFDQAFTATIAGMQTEKLLANSSGVTTPLGEVWFRKKGQGEKRGIRIVTINGVVVRQ